MSSSAFALNERGSEIADRLSQEKLISAEQAVQVEYIASASSLPINVYM